MATEAIRNNEMMDHLMGALEQGQDIGHYGRLVFVMVGRHFMDEDIGMAVVVPQAEQIGRGHGAQSVALTL